MMVRVEQNKIRYTVNFILWEQTDTTISLLEKIVDLQCKVSAKLLLSQYGTR